jgi:hypothetical protein
MTSGAKVLRLDIQLHLFRPVIPFGFPILGGLFLLDVLGDAVCCRRFQRCLGIQFPGFAPTLGPGFLAVLPGAGYRSGVRTGLTPTAAWPILWPILPRRLSIPSARAAAPGVGAKRSRGSRKPSAGRALPLRILSRASRARCFVGPRTCSRSLTLDPDRPAPALAGGAPGAPVCALVLALDLAAFGPLLAALGL